MVEAQQGSHERDKFGGLERIEQIAVDHRIDCSRSLDAAGVGHPQDRRRGAFLFHGLIKVGFVALRRFIARENEVEHFRIETAQSFTPGFDGRGLQPGLFQELHFQCARLRVLVDDQQFAVDVHRGGT